METAQITYGKILLYKDAEGKTQYTILIPAISPEQTIKSLKKIGCSKFVILDADLTHFEGMR